MLICQKSRCSCVGTYSATVLHQNLLANCISRQRRKLYESKGTSVSPLNHDSFARKPPRSSAVAFDVYWPMICCFTEPEVQWFKGPNVIKNSKYFRTFVSGNVCTLVITESFKVGFHDLSKLFAKFDHLWFTEQEDEGEYRCVARSPAGSISCSAFLKVLGEH